MMSLENDSKRLKFEILEQFCFLFRITYERVGIKMQRTKSRFVIHPENVLFAGALALFSPEILQTWAVKGLITTRGRELESLWKNAAVQLCGESPRADLASKNTFQGAIRSFPQNHALNAYWSSHE